jgi:hypothetical protein
MTEEQIMKPECIVYKIFLSKHPTDDNLEIGQVGPYQLVVGKHYRGGQLGFHVPEGAHIPDKLLDDMWLRGRLAGKKKNRVKNREMKGVISDGLFYGEGYYDENWNWIVTPSWNPNWKSGDNVADEVGIVD